MKRILIFIGLKLAEVVGVAIVLTGMAWAGNVIHAHVDHPWATCSIFESASAFVLSLFGFIAYTAMLFGALVCCFLLYCGIRALLLTNWKWAGKFILILCLLLPGVVEAGELEDCWKESAEYHATPGHSEMLCMAKANRCMELKFKDDKRSYYWQIKIVPLRDVNEFLKENREWEPFGGDFQTRFGSFYLKRRVTE